MSIHDGVDELIDRAFGVEDIGKPPHYEHRKSAARLSGGGVPDLDKPAFIRALYQRIQENGSASNRWPSSQNWRFVPKPGISKGNASREKTLEKAIARAMGEGWANQVPTASGLVTSGERQRSIDLVEQTGPEAFDFIELKVGSDTPLFAAMEILKNGLVFLYSLERRDTLGYTREANPLLWAEQVTLVVLAPGGYFDDRPYDFGWLGAALREGLAALVADGFRQLDELGFRFERFPEDFRWPCADRPLIDAVHRRRRVPW